MAKKKSKRSSSGPIIVPSERVSVKVRKKAADLRLADTDASPSALPSAASSKAALDEDEPALLDTEALAEGELLSVKHDEISCALETGLEIISQAESADKPRRLLSWLVAPLSLAQFDSEVRELRPMHLVRAASRAGESGYYTGWFGSKDLRALLADGQLRYTEDVDVTSYANGKRSTLNGDGAAGEEEVLAAFGRGCSVRLSWPQRYNDRVWALLSVIEEYFCCGAGCNVYWTPKGTQGFAPHYDDVDVFILQVEGEKHWTLHSPLSEAEALPRHSSADFAQSQLGDPLAEVVLRPGDMLYLPRGTVHQAKSHGPFSPGTCHARCVHLHITGFLSSHLQKLRRGGVSTLTRCTSPSPSVGSTRGATFSRWRS